ncbi:MAG TPA: hypothetical protein VMH26_13610 [Burkholderiales bacterium]|nr:hypothetical protein [Burkholderiales bacterium]
MPLRTDSLAQARTAYGALEARAQSAERRAEQLQALVTELRKVPPAEVDVVALLRQRILDLEAENIRLRTQLDQLAQLKTDLPLQNFVAAMGLAAAIGEASMPDRSIASMTTKVQAYLAPAGQGVGLRFQQPELGAFAVGLSTTAFEVAKIPPAAGVQAPRSLYAVLQDKQQVLADPFFARFAAATQVQVKIAELFANTGAWNFAYLLQGAAAMAAQERELAKLLAQQVSPGAVAAYAAAVDALAALAESLAGKANPVAGDVLALASALDLATGSLKTLLP